MAPAPVNLRIPRPDPASPEWLSQEPGWVRLNLDVGGNENFFPLTVKAFYVIGLMLAACRGVTILLQDKRLFDTTYFPAYAVFSSSIDLLGRCLRGNPGTKGTQEDLAAGFQWLAKPDFPDFAHVPATHTLVSTQNASYSIRTLVSFRNYAAHGQAVSSQPLPPFDYLVLEQFPPLLSRGMETYWSLLQTTELPCNSLAAALVTPYRNRPLFETLWSFKGGGGKPYPPIGDLFLDVDWTYNPPPIRLGAA